MCTTGSLNVRASERKNQKGKEIWTDPSLIKMNSEVEIIISAGIFTHIEGVGWGIHPITLPLDPSLPLATTSGTP